MGALVVAPVLLTWASSTSFEFSPWRWLEIFCLVVLVIVTSWVGFNLSKNLYYTTMIPYLIFPLYMWASLRFSPREVAALTLTSSLIAIMGVSNGRGPFVVENINWSLLYLWAYMIILSMVSLLLTAAVHERKKAEKDYNELLSQTLELQSEEISNEREEVKSFQHLQKSRLTASVFQLGLFSILVTSLFEYTVSLGSYDRQNLFNVGVEVAFIASVVTVIGYILLKRQRELYQEVLSQAVEKRRLEEAQEVIHQLNNELEARVEERTAQLEMTNKELEAFSYSVSHDLRAPLRSIQGFGKIILEDFLPVLDEKGQGYLNRVLDASQRMEKLIDGLLQLSRVNQSNLQMSKIDMSKLFDGAIRELALDKAKEEVEWSIVPGISAWGDRNLLQVVLVNLVQNAWKFSPNSSPRKIEFGFDEKEAAYFVKDNGVGFSMSYVDKLFQPFQRLHGTNEFEGTGIGLATVQRIVYRHGGRVWAEGKVDEGAVFYFTLGAGEKRRQLNKE